MERTTQHQNQIAELGFTVVENIYSETEIREMLSVIDTADTSNDTFRKSSDLFAIRQFLNEIPDIQKCVFNENLSQVIQSLFGAGYFVVKSIYFDKPEASNWYVAYHQDLTISVDKKIEYKDFGPWTVKQNQFSVCPPIAVLENNFTIRIHLDDTNEQNGALKVIERSHAKGIYRPQNINWETEKQTSCNVPKGGIMIMKPLLLHSSGRTTNAKKRRVIHIEFSSFELPNGLNWSERINAHLSAIVSKDTDARQH